MEETLTEDKEIRVGKEIVEGMEYIYFHHLAWPIYEEDDKRPFIINNIFDKVKKETNPCINSKEELDSLKEKPYAITVNQGIFVKDVERIDENSYSFTLKDLGIRCRTNYGWSLLENTPHNVNKIKNYMIEDEKLKKQKKTTDLLWRVIDKLK